MTENKEKMAQKCGFFLLKTHCGGAIVYTFCARWIAPGGAVSVRTLRYLGRLKESELRAVRELVGAKNHVVPRYKLPLLDELQKDIARWNSCRKP